MNDFITLFFQLDQTNKISNKMEALESFFIKASPPDRLWMIAIFTGRYPKRLVNIRFLKEWVIEETGLPQWLFEETYRVIGDLAETLALLLPQRPSTSQSTLSEWMLAIQDLTQQNFSEKKNTILAFWNRLDSKERWVFNKLLIGSFRLGVSQNLLVKALAHVTGVEANVIAHRLMEEWQPTQVDPNFLLKSTEAEVKSARPYPFCLAYPLNIPLENLGPCSDWLVEWKWDGIRSQLVHRHEFFTLWSREEEVVNDRFPELFQLKQILPEGIVLDGEIVACQDETILPFSVLQQRIGKTVINSAILKQFPVSFVAYDLLEWQGQDQRSMPLDQRRALLEYLFQNLKKQLLLRLSPQLIVDRWEDVRHLREQSRLHAAEGIMLKKLDSIYHVGRTRGNWWKWKVDPYTVNAVLLYAKKSHDWRDNLYSDYTFAVWDQKGQLIPFAKVYSGLTKQELAEVNRFIKSHTIEKFGPVRSVIPELVFEISFESIQLSNRHKSGLVVRFPRIYRWRKDIKPEEADTIETLKALIHSPK